MPSLLSVSFFYDLPSPSGGDDDLIRILSVGDDDLSLSVGDDDLMCR